jgi:hypothetical protein
MPVRPSELTGRHVGHPHDTALSGGYNAAALALVAELVDAQG